MNRIEPTLRKTLLFASAMSMIGFAAPAFAQDTATQADAGSTVEELVVTARRREEALQDVPISVSAFSAEQLERIGAPDITTLQQTTPNATVQVARGSSSTLITFIRGVGQQDPLWGNDPGVGLYIDDVYVARPQGAVLDIYDIQRIEVLRGPQGTLYGRNTIGGAIKYVTAPITDSELKIRTTYGSYNQREALISAKTPVGDKFAAGITIAKFLRDGFGENLTTGAEHYDKDVLAARATLEFRPNDDVFIRLSTDLVRDESNAKHGHRLLPFINILGAPIAGGGVLDDVYDTRAGIGDINFVETSGVALMGAWDLNEQVTLKSISAYRTGKTETVIDFDSMPENVLDIPAIYDDHQFSQEFQLLYSGERLQGVAGFYFLNSTASGAFDTIIGRANLNTATKGQIDTTSWSIFGDASYDITDQLAISLGGRWTHDEKTATQFRANFLGAYRSPFTGGKPRTPFAIRTNYEDQEKTFEEFTPRASLSYEINPDLTAYVSYSKGFKSGGFDMRGDAVLYPDTVKGYKPETVDSYEVGLKGALFDRHLTFATDLFHGTYKDIQITAQYPVGAGIASVFDNAGSATIWGWEFEANGRLTDWLSANLAVGYVNSEFDEYLAFIPLASGAQCAPNAAVPPTPAGCLVDVADQRDIQNTPDWTGSFGLTFNHDLGDMGRITFTPRASYRGDSQMFEAANAMLDQQAYWLYDASLVWTDASDRYQVSLNGRNLADEEYRVGGYVFAGALLGNSVTGFYGPPRTVSVSVQAKF